MRALLLRYVKVSDHAPNASHTHWIAVEAGLMGWRKENSYFCWESNAISAVCMASSCYDQTVEVCHFRVTKTFKNTVSASRTISLLVLVLAEEGEGG